MLRNGRLRDPEFATDDFCELACRAFAFGEQFEESTSGGDTEHIEGFHCRHCFTTYLYKSISKYGGPRATLASTRCGRASVEPE